MIEPVIVSKSSIHGKGVVANKEFKKGQRIFILKGKIKKLKIRSSADSALGPNWVGLAKEVWIDPEYPAQFLNHSCEPNMGIRGKVTFVALRDIKKGEELTFDYSTTEDDLLWSFKCQCGSKNCRKLLKSIQFLDKETYQHYLPFIPTYFKKVYNKGHR